MTCAESLSQVMVICHGLPGVVGIRGKNIELKLIDSKLQSLHIRKLRTLQPLTASRFWLKTPDALASFDS